jgi:prepilin-type N-terminal cleavage/methylation domain-containing protein
LEDHKKMSNSLRKAFTLVELLVVISIIGVLSSVVFASLSSAKTRAKEAKLVQMMSAVNSAAQTCVNSGIALTVPASSGAGGSVVCTGDAAVLPDITDTGFSYCGVGCGGWVSDVVNNRYAISVHTTGRYIVCGSGYDASAWFGGGVG